MEKIANFILEILNEMAEEQDNPALANLDLEARLFGERLDSMGIVFLVTDLEAKISDELDVDIILADERAMSQKTSPFRSVKTLANYATQLVEENV